MGYKQSLEEKKRQAVYERHEAKKPTYTSPMSGEISKLYEQISQRKPFSYDFDADELYQRYKDSAMEQGKLAMQDAMGQASAMTGGYGNSYAQTVGNQAYQGYMQQANDMIPELYQMAYDRYTREGADLYDRYNAAVSRENAEYGRYLDQMDQWNTDRGYLFEESESDAAENNEFGMGYSQLEDLASTVRNAIAGGATREEIMSALKNGLETGEILPREYELLMNTFLRRTAELN